MARDNSSRTYRILAVDNEPNQVLILDAALRKLPNVEVFTADSAEEALNLFQQHPFDLVITDYRMRGMDGLTLAAGVRRLRPHAPIVLVTAYPDEVRERARHMSLFAILEKPVSVKDIRTTALKALGFHG